MTSRDINDWIHMETTCRETNPVGSFYPTLITILVFTIFTFGINWVKSKLKTDKQKMINILAYCRKREERRIHEYEMSARRATMASNG